MERRTPSEEQRERRINLCVPIVGRWEEYRDSRVVPRGMYKTTKSKTTWSPACLGMEAECKSVLHLSNLSIS
jgi:hypothetical protein